MELFEGIYQYFYSRFGEAMWYILGFFVLVGVVAQWRLFDKAGQPGWTCVVHRRGRGAPAGEGGERGQTGWEAKGYAEEEEGEAPDNRRVLGRC